MNKIKEGEKYGIQGGFLIAFEGIDGSGKSTQIQLLSERLKEEQFMFTIFHEPTNGKWGQKIRELVKHSRSHQDELHWFVEDRKEDVQLNIKPALEKNLVVIMDRYYYSSVAYQGTVGGNPDYIMELNSFAPRPNLCFILDCDPNDAFSRIKDNRRGRTDYFEKLENLLKVRQMYLDYFRNYPEVRTIPYLEKSESIHEEIWNILRDEIGKIGKVKV